jgi:DNA-binding CsgD family transcriptional regulator
MTREQAAGSFSKLAVALGYSATLIVDAPKLSSALATSVIYSEWPRYLARAQDEELLLLTHPVVRLAGGLDAPFSIRDVCEHVRVPETELRRSLPDWLQEAQIVFLPVHRLGRLRLLVICSGTNPSQTIVSRALLHTCAHALYDRCATLGDGMSLPRREADCLFWAAQGKTYAEIGRILNVSPRTVRSDLAKAKRELSVGTKGGAIAKAIARSGR